MPSSLARRASLSILLLAACSSSGGADGDDAGVTDDSAMASDDAGGDPMDARGDDDGPLVADDATPGDDVVTPDDTVSVPTDADTPVAPGDLSVAGPLTSGTLEAMLAMPNSTGCSGALCNTNLHVTFPTSAAAGRAAPYPLVVFSNGFNTPATQYASYATRLASWGYVVVRYDVPSETIFAPDDHSTLANFVIQLIDWADARNSDTASMLHGLVDAQHTVTVGHSRGGKVSILAGTRNARIIAAVGIDPVDSPPPGQSFSAAYPSAIAALQSTAHVLPLAALQSDLGGTGLMACAPSQYNAAHFYDASTGPAFTAILANTGHMQFIDSRSTCGISCIACATGSAADATVKTFTQTITVAWAEHYTRGTDITSYIDGTWLRSQLTAHTISSARHR